MSAKSGAATRTRPLGWTEKARGQRKAWGDPPWRWLDAICPAPAVGIAGRDGDDDGGRMPAGRREGSGGVRRRASVRGPYRHRAADLPPRRRDHGREPEL